MFYNLSILAHIAIIYLENKGLAQYYKENLRDGKAQIGCRSYICCVKTVFYFIHKKYTEENCQNLG